MQRIKKGIPSIQHHCKSVYTMASPPKTVKSYVIHSLSNQNEMLNLPLAEADKEIASLIAHETKRQFSGLELIASENFTSRAVMEANGSILTNKYSEGLPGARYYGGNEFIDQIEELCKKRALEAFNLDGEKWGVNVQPYSGSTANFAAFTGMLQPNDRIMGLDLPSGGHLTHGYQTAKKKISSSSIYFQSMPYQVCGKTGMIDYDQLEKNAKLFHPKMIICGASAYPREWDYGRLRKIADDHGAFLMADVAHISGLIAAQQVENPFNVCDIVTTTTHKTLRGPRAGLIFFRKQDLNGKATDYEARINQAVFPSCQGGPHNNTIAAVAIALKQASTPEFRLYAKQVMLNSKQLAKSLMNYGYKIVTDGTDNHLLLWDLRPLGLTGSKLEKLCDMVSITINKNSIYGDVSALAPGGVRLGTAALTSRSFEEKDFERVAEFLKRTVDHALEIQKKVGASKLLKDFIAVAVTHEPLLALRREVEQFSEAFDNPGLMK